MASYRRIQMELKEWLEDGYEIPGCSIKLKVGNSLKKFKAEIGGPTDTPYEGGKFNVKIVIPPQYPIDPPKVEFRTKIWHPNISYEYGSICLDILRENWLATMTMRTTLLSVQSLLDTPSFTDPLNDVATTQRNTSVEIYERTAKYWTHVYANGPFQCLEYDQKMKMMKERHNYNKFTALTYLSICDWNVDEDGRGIDETI